MDRITTITDVNILPSRRSIPSNIILAEIKVLFNLFFFLTSRLIVWFTNCQGKDSYSAIYFVETSNRISRIKEELHQRSFKLLLIGYSNCFNTTEGSYFLPFLFLSVQRSRSLKNVNFFRCNLSTC